MHKIFVLPLLACVLCSAPICSPAADVYVGVGFYELTPDPVSMKSGDIVYWVEADPDFGPYIISIFSYQLPVPYGVQILSPGSYPYTAQSIYGGQWSGTVNVRTNAYPTVTIDSPTNNATFNAPASFTIAATASDLDPNDIYSVEFWMNGELAGTDYAEPYSVTLVDVPAGNYSLKAIVKDYGNATATNSIAITVGSGAAITLTSPRVFGSNLVFTATGLTVGRTNVLLSSTNVVNWTASATNVAASTSISFTNGMSGAQRFFRVLQMQ